MQELNEQATISKPTPKYFIQKLFADKANSENTRENVCLEKKLISFYTLVSEMFKDLLTSRTSLANWISNSLQVLHLAVHLIHCVPCAHEANLQN